MWPPTLRCRTGLSLDLPVRVGCWFSLASSNQRQLPGSRNDIELRTGLSLDLPIFAKHCSVLSMTTMNISLPATLKEFVDQQVTTAGYGTSSEYVRQLIRRDQDRCRLRNLLLEGAQPPPTGIRDPNCFASLRSDIKKRLAKSA